MCISCRLPAEVDPSGIHISFSVIIERLMCEVEFFGRCCFGERYTRLFFMWAGYPLTHYQNVDLEDIVY